MTTNRHTNRLADEKSPYLLQHKHNPVDWFPWGEEAFRKAKAENKPIFLSIGYSTCHWCHVMEQESFEDPEVAERLNRHFVSIKVDREERPDIDHIYMTVCQAMTGHGGWPLSIFLTPDKKPFFAGTYFPKHGRHGHRGFMELLKIIQAKWEGSQEEILQTSEKITQAIAEHVQKRPQGESDITESELKKAYAQFHRLFDADYGGFGEAPKFPTPHNLLFLLRYWKRFGNEEALAMVKKTLDGMANGGIYDHIGFGFARYSTDNEWLVPHFEKMLYDNALLAYTYLEAYQATKESRYAQTAREIFTYILRDMTSPEGGFYSAEDADSEGEEGKFYVWSREEIEQILTEDADLFSRYYGVTGEGNFEGKNILHRIDTPSLQTLASDHNLSVDALAARLQACRERMFQERERRIHPHKDDKILTSWNGLMIAAFAKGAQVFQEATYQKAAESAAAFILNRLRDEKGRLLARYREGEAAYPGYIDDYAFFIWGLIELYQATFDASYLAEAVRLHEDMMELFWDDENGGFFFYGNDAEPLIARPKETYDGAIPSGNSMAAYVTFSLQHLTGDLTYRDIGDRILQSFADEVKNYPAGHAHFLNAWFFTGGDVKEIVIAGTQPNETFHKMLDVLRTSYLPNSVILSHNEQGEGAEILLKTAPFIQDKHPVNGHAAVYICENYACQSPITDAESLQNQLAI